MDTRPLQPLLGGQREHPATPRDREDRPWRPGRTGPALSPRGPGGLAVGDGLGLSTCWGKGTGSSVDEGPSEVSSKAQAECRREGAL